MKRWIRGLGYAGLIWIGGQFSACTTKSEIRREQEVEKLKQEVKGERADADTQTEELKTDVARMSSAIDDHAALEKQSFDEIKKEIAALGTRIQALEQRAVNEDLTAKKAEDDRSKATYENGKKLFDDGKYEDATEMLRNVLGKTHPKSDDAKKTEFLIAESLFAAKNFGEAAIEFGEFEKNYPKDPLIPTAIYRQANSFRNLGKPKDAKLFYQELIERFPKNPLAAKARQERRHLK